MEKDLAPDVTPLQDPLQAGEKKLLQDNGWHLQRSGSFVVK